MQGFNGLSYFCVLLLMALGLAIIFGQMGVINMAHGEFLTIGAYTTYVLSTAQSSTYAPWLADYYFLLAIVLVVRHRRRASGCAVEQLHDPAALQAAARHAAGHLGPEPDHAADLSLDLRRARRSAPRCPSG